MRISPSRVIGCGLIVALVGCQEYPLASRYIKSVPVQASQGALVTVDASESQELAGASISIPAGALRGDTTVTVELGLETLATGANASVSPVVVWGPAGTKLDAPAEVVIPFALQAGQPVEGLRVNMLLGDGRKVALDRVAFTIDGNGHAARLRVEELAALEVEVSQCNEEHPCEEGRICHEGVCKPPKCGGTYCATGQLCCNDHCKTVEPGTTVCPAPQCGEENPCPNDGLCHEGVCFQRCGETLPACPDGLSCKEGVCVHRPSGCGAERPCAEGFVCDQGACRFRCGPDFPDRHCPAPQICLENYVCK